PKFCLKNSSGAWFEIEKLAATVPLAPDSLGHVVDLRVKIDMLAGLVPGVFGDRHKLLRQRAGDRTSAGQRLQLPRLRSLGIIALVSLKRKNERPLLSFRSRQGVNARKISFRAWLRHTHK